MPFLMFFYFVTVIFYKYENLWFPFSRYSRKTDWYNFVKEIENTYRKNLVLLRMIKLHFKK